jgi:hypothetical protein
LPSSLIIVISNAFIFSTSSLELEYRYGQHIFNNLEINFFLHNMFKNFIHRLQIKVYPSFNLFRYNLETELNPWTLGGGIIPFFVTHASIITWTNGYISKNFLLFHIFNALLPYNYRKLLFYIYRQGIGILFKIR